jgi:hypothetical protein
MRDQRVSWTRVYFTVSKELFMHFFTGAKANNFNFDWLPRVGYELLGNVVNGNWSSHVKDQRLTRTSNRSSLNN